MDPLVKKDIIESNCLTISSSGMGFIPLERKTNPTTTNAHSYIQHNFDTAALELQQTHVPAKAVRKVANFLCDNLSSHSKLSSLSSSHAFGSSDDTLRSRSDSSSSGTSNGSNSAGRSSFSSSSPRPNFVRRLSRGAIDKIRRRSSVQDVALPGPVVTSTRNSSQNIVSSSPLFWASADDLRYSENTIGTDPSPPCHSNDDNTITEPLVPSVQSSNSSSNWPTLHTFESPEESVTESIIVPEGLKKGTPFLRITRRKKVHRVIQLDAEAGVMCWQQKSSSKLCIDNIREIRTADDARNYREELKISSEHASKWMTIIYTDTNSKLRALHLIALSSDNFDMLCTSLQNLFKYRRETMRGIAISGDDFINAHWRKFNSRQEGQERLDFQGVERLARRLHVNCSHAYLLEKFQQADIDGSGYLDFREFQSFVKLLKQRPEISQIFRDIISDSSSSCSQNQTRMNIENFRYFINSVQKQDMPEQTLLHVFHKFSNEDDKGLTFESFSDYLLSSYNPVYYPSAITQDLTRPINEYFISSSHNTYLMGRQVAGESSIEAYVQALQRGCRCVEIDCWDGPNGPNNNNGGGPLVNHGRTFTSDIRFSDVIDSIAKYAFISSPYPLILSLEVHCGLEQQNRMAEIMKSILGDSLVTRPLFNDNGVLPTPMDLRLKILVKVKHPTSPTPVPLTIGNDDHLSSSGNEATTGSSSNATSDGEQITQQHQQRRSLEVQSTPRGPRLRRMEQNKISQALADLAVYVKGIKFRNFSLPESKQSNHIFSFGERSFTAMTRDQVKLAQLEKHNSRFLMRVYPSGFRISSTNFDPIGCWKYGVQMAALNWQTYDLGLQINDGMFIYGQTAGYVLKPKYLRERNVNQIEKRRRLAKSHTFKITIVSAQQLPRPKDLRIEDTFDPCVEVEIFGRTGASTINRNIRPPTSLRSATQQQQQQRQQYRADGGGGPTINTSSCTSTLTKRFRTDVIHENGFNPVWNESFIFAVNASDLDFTFLRVAITANDQIFASFCARIVNLQQGYRHVPLFDVLGEQYIFSTLFVRMELV